MLLIKVYGKTVATNLRAANGTLNTTIPTPTAGSHKLQVAAGETASYATARNETK